MAGTRIASVSGIRGVVGNGFDPSVAGDFAAAYASMLQEGPIVVGHDARVTAPIFEAAVVASIRATGHDVLLAGPVATPTLGRLVVDRGAVGGVQISASHNPPQYNGLKFFQPGGMVLGPAAGRAMLDRWEAREIAWAAWDRLGGLEPVFDPDSRHLDRVLAIVDVEAIRQARFVVGLDACHGAGGRLGASLLRSLGAEAIVLGGLPDGRYDHPPEPTEANLSKFARIIPAMGANVGFAQDPDADRLAIIDETGRYIGEELTLALAASHRLSQAIGPVVFNLSTSRTTEDLAGRFGASVVRTPVGEIHVVEAIRGVSALIGGEGNGGVIDPRVGYVRDSFVAMALILDLMAQTGESLSSLVAALPQYAMVKDQYPRPVGLGGIPSDPAELFDRIAATYPDATTDRRDGLRLDWEDRWVHVRASNTEPIVRVIAEATDAATARALADRLGQVVADGRGSA